MPLEQIPDISSQYYQINYDASGTERAESNGSKISQKVLEVLTQEAITDVFIFLVMVGKEISLPLVISIIAGLKPWQKTRLIEKRWNK